MGFLQRPPPDPMILFIPALCIREGGIISAMLLTIPWHIERVTFPRLWHTIHIYDRIRKYLKLEKYPRIASYIVDSLNYYLMLLRRMFLAVALISGSCLSPNNLGTIFIKPWSVFQWSVLLKLQKIIRLYQNNASQT